uniref:N-acetylglucosaminylphosphatidylinositol deacetylase n=2 Tax=Kalanchoe fedtschenkoi TaxID=63787 RepID=A0A7N0TJX8_KALFE
MMLPDCCHFFFFLSILLLGFNFCCSLDEVSKNQMAWLLIGLSVSLCWLASLCKVYYSSHSSSRTAFFTESKQKRNILLVIAHPDDESMFFSPTISYLTSKGHNLYVLCISTGNADGMGNTRKEELYQACAILKVPLHQIKVLDNPKLQDGFGKVWDHDLLAKIVEEEVASGTIDSILTFDSYGISGHCNHKDVHHGVRRFLNMSRRKVEAWELLSTNILRKYSGPVDIWFSIVYSMCWPSGQVHCLLNDDPSKSFQAMAQHMSQWVWFRKLFVSFSSYTYVNTLKRIA